jgi:hypothetical protein
LRARLNPWDPMSSALHQNPAPSHRIVLVVLPSFDVEVDGRRVQATIKRGLLFDAKVGDRVVVRRTIQPLLDGCRALIAEGYDPGSRIVMRHDGSGIDAFADNGWTCGPAHR